MSVAPKPPLGKVRKVPATPESFVDAVGSLHAGQNFVPRPGAEFRGENIRFLMRKFWERAFCSFTVGDPSAETAALAAGYADASLAEWFKRFDP